MTEKRIFSYRAVCASFLVLLSIQKNNTLYLRLWAMPSHEKSMVISGESQQKNAKGR